MAFSLPKSSWGVSPIPNFQNHWGIEEPDIKLSRDLLKGNGVRVAVLDTAVDGDHDDLELSGSFDFVKNMEGDATKSEMAHGTFVSGIIGARTSKDGMDGMAPKCELFSGRILGKSGLVDNSILIEAINWAIKDVKAHIINLSIRDIECNNNLQTKIEDEIRLANRDERSLTFVCAAGNTPGSRTSPNIEFPAAYQNTLAIGSLMKGARTTMGAQGQLLDFVAPGDQVTSLFPNNKYAISGSRNSSFAAAFFTGALALFFEDWKKCFNKFPTPIEVKKALITTAKDINEPGFDPGSGYGRIGLINLLIRNRVLKTKLRFDPQLPNSDFEKELTTLETEVSDLKAFQEHYQFQISNSN